MKIAAFGAIASAQEENKLRDYMKELAKRNIFIFGEKITSCHPLLSGTWNLIVARKFWY